MRFIIYLSGSILRNLVVISENFPPSIQEQNILGFTSTRDLDTVLFIFGSRSTVSSLQFENVKVFLFTHKGGNGPFSVLLSTLHYSSF